ncbi:uncharacterized protein LOC127164244 isoform X2 [Labeo rohita]|uniref:uncharacterized protein LOC127164244 isoform X2 n=1 Tax=Labeo rohita TaxID=84645 RepID=UPI0021E2C50E|nr:uncharacterized protein LOC127164244 isoform X2 [Labeo rohita]
MAFVKVESEGLRIEKVFSLKCEDTEEQTDTMAVKEENQEVKIEENSTETGNTSSGNGAQECLEPYICDMMAVKEENQEIKIEEKFHRDWKYFLRKQRSRMS